MTTTPPNQNPSIVQQKPVQVQSLVTQVLQKAKQAKNIQVRPFFEDIVTFVSIIGAYQYVSLSYQKEKDIQRWTGMQFTNKRTQAIILLIFAVYIISLKVLHFIAYKYDTAPPKKIIPDNWQQMEESSQPIQQQIVQPSQQKVLPPDSYSVMIQELIQHSIYGFVFMFCTTSYTFISVFNKKNNLVDVQQINYLMLWYVTANILYAVGKIIGKMTKINTLHHFGFSIGVIVLVLQIGLAHGFNTFIFI